MKFRGDPPVDDTFDWDDWIDSFDREAPEVADGDLEPWLIDDPIQH